MVRIGFFADFDSFYFNLLYIRLRYKRFLNNIVYNLALIKKHLMEIEANAWIVHDFLLHIKVDSLHNN